MENLKLESFVHVHCPFTLCGTIPIGIDVEGSDLDVLFHASDLDDLKQEWDRRFNKSQDFVSFHHEFPSGLSAVARFCFDGERIELFAQKTPVHRQLAFRHMVIEWRLLRLAGPEFRKRIVTLKQNGVKTEPSFAKILGLMGDPYTVLLSLEYMSDVGLADLLRRASFEPSGPNGAAL
jgi:hypothetical protein